MVLPTKTTHYSLDLPRFNASTWHDEINGNFIKLDSMLAATGFPDARGFWEYSTLYEVDDRVFDVEEGTLWLASIEHTSAASGTFAEERAAHPTYWAVVDTGLVMRSEWAPATQYNARDVAYDANEGILGIATTEHTSTTSMRDDAANWDFIVDVSVFTEAVKDFAIDRTNHVNADPVYDPQGILDDAFDRANHTGANVPDNVSVTRAKINAAVEKSIKVNPLEFGAVGDGTTNDTAAVQAALDTGLDVHLPADYEFLIGDVIVDSQTISGDGVLVKRAASPFGVILSGTFPQLFGVKMRAEATIGQPNALIKLEDGCIGPRVTNCFLDGETASTYAGIVAAQETSDVGTDYPYTASVKGLHMSGCIVLGFARAAYLLCVTDYNISDNYFARSTFDALRIRETIQNGIIANNHFVDTGDFTAADAQTRDCIDTAFGGGKLIIANNFMTNPAFCGIDIKGISTDDAGTSREIIITGNRIKGARRSGISITCDVADAPDFLPEFLITNNIITEFNQFNSAGAGGVADAGISIDRQVRNATIMGNLIMGGYGRGINAPGDVAANTKSRNLIISQNQIFNNLETAVNLGNVSGCIITGNIVGNDTAAYTKAGHTGSIVPSGGGHTIGFAFTATEADAKYSAIFAHNIVRSVSSLAVSVAGTNALVDAFSVFSPNAYIDCPAPSGSTARWIDETSGEFWGDGVVPAASSGTFQTGARIRRKAPVAGSYTELVHYGSGAWGKTGQTRLEGSASVNPPSIAASSIGGSGTISVPGAALGDIVRSSFSLDLGSANLIARVTAADTVSYTFQNMSTASPVDLGTGTIKVWVEKDT